MTSTTLSFKSNFKAAFFKTFKKCLVDMIIIFAAAVIIPVTAMIITLMTEIGTKGTTDISSVLLSVLIATTVVCALFSLAIAPKMFKEIYKKQSCDLYFSMPIKREVYFCANYLYGLMINAAAFFSSPILYMTAAPMMSTKRLEFIISYTFGEFLSLAIPLFLAVIVCYTVFVMCAVTAGKLFHYLVLCIISSCLSSAVSGVIVNLNTIWGLYIDPFMPMSIDPVQNAMSNLAFEGKKALLLSFISIAEIVILFFAGIVVFKKRKAEVAEVTLTGKVVPYVMLAVAAFAAYMHYSAVGIAVLSIVFGIIVSVITALIFTAIFYKKALTKQTGITLCAVCLVCTLFIGTVYFPKYSTFVKNVPDAEEIESIEISNHNDTDLYLSSVLNIFLSEELYLDETDVSTIVITEETAIKNAVALHNRLIDDEVIKKSTQYNNSTLLSTLFLNNSYNEYTQTYDFKIEYTLKSGKKLSRTYCAATEMIMDEYANLTKDKHILSQYYPLSISNDDFLFATVDSSFAYYDDYDTFMYDDSIYDQMLDIEQYNELAEIYIGDLLKLDNADFISTTSSLGTSYFYCEKAEQKSTLNTVAEISVCCINKNAPEKIREQLKGMTPKELQHGYERFMYNDESSPFNYIDFAYINVSGGQKQLINYLQSHGAVIFNK